MGIGRSYPYPFNVALVFLRHTNKGSQRGTNASRATIGAMWWCNIALSSKYPDKLAVQDVEVSFEIHFQHKSCTESWQELRARSDFPSFRNFFFRFEKAELFQPNKKVWTKKKSSDTPTLNSVFFEIGVYET